MGKVNIEKYQQLSLDLQPVKIPFDADAKPKFKAHRAAGDYVQCPCCNMKYNIIYKRHLYHSIITGLKNLYAGHGATSSIGDFAKLRYWGLIERAEGKKQGQWRITPLGIDFVEGRARLPESVIVKNNVVIAKGKSLITIHEVRK